MCRCAGISSVIASSGGEGILAENRAIEEAARQCLGEGRTAVDQRFRDGADAIGDQYPGCPPARADAIAYLNTLHGRGRHRFGPVRTPDEAVADSVHARVEEVLTAWRDGATTLDT